MSESGKKSLVLYHDIRAPLEMLDDEERGKLFSAILNYSEYGELPEFEGALQMAFAFIRTAIDRDADKWEEKRQKRVESGRMGGLKRMENRRLAQADTGEEAHANQANATFAKQTKQNQANQAVPVPGNVPVPVPGSVPGNGIERGADKPPRASRFVPPTLEEVAAYCRERANGIDAQHFLDYYTANGWVQGKGKPIRDWKATVRTWERRDDHAGRSDSGHGADAAQTGSIGGITRL